MSQQIQKRVSALRNFLEAKNLHAFIIPSSDIHQSEYPPAHWSGREWISGFSGSAGTVVVTRNEAGLWTDSRYFLQAEEELRGTGIDLFRDRLPQTPTIAQWLSSVLQNGDRVGVDGNVYSAKDVIALKRTLSPNGLEVNTEYDPFEVIWADRPFIPKNPVFEMPIEFSGVPVSAKINQINTALQTLGADGLLMASLDTLAWLFNLRGNDVPYNPVFVAFGYVSLKETVLFLYPEKLNQDIVALSLIHI